MTPAGIRATSTAAPWRPARLGHWGLIARLRQQRHRISPLLRCVAFDAKLCKLDWLHVMDLGVACDWLGQFFVFLVPKYPGASIDARISALWRHIQALYAMYPPRARLDNFTRKMLSWDRASYKLRTYGSETHSLIPIGRHLAQQQLSDADGVEHTVKQAMLELSACYDALSSRAAPGALAEHSRRFCGLHVALETHVPDIFYVKPKMHQMQELCEMVENAEPAKHWDFREEEFGGSVVALGKRHGGQNTPGATGKQTLDRFCARHQVPDLSP